MDDVVAGRPQPLDDTHGDTHVGEETHRLPSIDRMNLFPCEPSSVLQGFSDIFGL